MILIRPYQASMSHPYIHCADTLFQIIRSTDYLMNHHKSLSPTTLLPLSAVGARSWKASESRKCSTKYLSTLASRCSRASRGPKKKPHVGSLRSHCNCALLIGYSLYRSFRQRQNAYSLPMLSNHSESPISIVS
jgi:hypothetical protein